MEPKPVKKTKTKQPKEQVPVAVVPKETEIDQVDPELVKQKRIKALQKKIRHINELKTKSDLNEEQREKLNSLNEIEAELNKLSV